LALLVDALIVDPWGLQRDRPGPDGDLALTRPAVTDHETMPVLIALVLEPGNVLIRLSAQRSRNHPPRALSTDVPHF